MVQLGPLDHRRYNVYCGGSDQRRAGEAIQRLSEYRRRYRDVCQRRGSDPTGNWECVDPVEARPADEGRASGRGC